MRVSTLAIGTHGKSGVTEHDQGEEGGEGSVGGGGKGSRHQVALFVVTVRSVVTII